MSTCQMQLTDTWSDVFPETQVTQLQSTVFVKKLLAIAVSNIAYMRLIYPDQAFGDRRLEDLNLKILKYDKSCPSASQMVDWLKGVFDALDKKYLRVLIFGVYRSSGDPNNLLEMYTFRFSYTDATKMEMYSKDGKISSASTANETKKATIALLRNLIVLVQALSPLPDDVKVTMKLFYYDDVTPQDYEPPGFQPAEKDFISMEKNPMKFRFHAVRTAFHSLQVSVRAGEDEATSVCGQQIIAGCENGLDVEMIDSQVQREDVVDSTTPTQSEMGKVGERCSQPSTSPPAALDDGTETEVFNDVEPQGVRCPCKDDEDDGLMILCSVCHYWQHAVCFRILEECDSPLRHVCSLCAGSSPSQSTDPLLADVPEAEAQMICLWRRTLDACMKTRPSAVSAVELAERLGCDKTVSSRLIDRLVAEGYATTKGKHACAIKWIHKRKIKAVAMPKYFMSNKVCAMEVD